MPMRLEHHYRQLCEINKFRLAIYGCGGGERAIFLEIAIIEASSFKFLVNFMFHQSGEPNKNIANRILNFANWHSLRITGRNMQCTRIPGGRQLLREHQRDVNYEKFYRRARRTARAARRTKVRSQRLLNIVCGGRPGRIKFNCIVNNFTICI